MEGGEGSIGVDKYYVTSVGAYNDSYQRRRLARRTAAVN